MSNVKTPWYKQFWPWFIICIPLSAVIMGVVMITLAIEGKDPLVREDWYKDGMAINQRLDKRHKARDANLKAFISFDNAQNILTIQVNNLDTAQEPSLHLELVHPTLSNRDIKTELYKTPDNNYFAKLNTTPQGHYYALISSDQGEWEIESRVNFARTLNHVELN